MRFMEITTKIGCVNNCKYCPQAKLMGSYCFSMGNMMGFGDYKFMLDKIPRSVIISFGGFSEAFQNPECLDMIKYTAARGYNLSINTTLIGINLKIIKDLENIRMDTISIHLPNLAGDENIISDSKYKRVLDYVCKSKLPASFICFGEPRKCVERIMTRNGIDKKKYVASKDLLNDRGGNLDFGRNKVRRKDELICGGDRLKGNILLPNGDVVLCCQDYGLKHKIGSLMTMSYKDLFESKEYRSILLRLKRGGYGTLCKTCEWAIYKDSKEYRKYKIGKVTKQIKLRLKRIKNRLR